MRVLGYVRVSTDEQADGGRSLETQRAKITMYAALHGLELVAVVEDAGHSAKSLDRPGIRSALEALEGGEVAGVLVTKLDRLSRSVRDWSTLVDRYFGDRAGRALLSVEDHIDTRTASGRLVLNVLMSVSAWEREAIGERTAAVLRHKLAKGEVVGRPPRGLRVVGLALEPDPGSDGLTLYRRARELRAEGMTLREIADRLTVEGFQPERGRAFWPSTVRGMLANPRLRDAAA